MENMAISDAGKDVAWKVSIQDFNYQPYSNLRDSLALIFYVWF